MSKSSADIPAPLFTASKALQSESWGHESWGQVPLTLGELRTNIPVPLSIMKHYVLLKDSDSFALNKLPNAKLPYKHTYLS